jgi:F-type H+-transporting ATPase subunit epsilon
MADIRCTIVTPSRALFDAAVRYASFPAWDGQQGAAGGMSPLLTRLGIGPLRVDLPDGGSQWFLVEGGFAQVQDDVLTILTERATPADELQAEEAERELNAANSRAVGGGVSREIAEADQQRARAKRALTAAR